MRSRISTSFFCLLQAKLHRPSSRTCLCSNNPIQERTLLDIDVKLKTRSFVRIAAMAPHTISVSFRDVDSWSSPPVRKERQQLQAKTPVVTERRTKDRGSESYLLGFNGATKLPVPSAVGLHGFCGIAGCDVSLDSRRWWWRRYGGR